MTLFGYFKKVHCTSTSPEIEGFVSSRLFAADRPGVGVTRQSPWSRQKNLFLEGENPVQPCPSRLSHSTPDSVAHPTAIFTLNGNV